MGSGKINEFARKYVASVEEGLKALSEEKLSVFAQWLRDAKVRKRVIWVAGNGGSGSTSDHFCVDLMKFGGVKAIPLSDNQATVLAVGNDIGFEFIFSEQVKALANPGDLVVLISGSGNSPNVVNAAVMAKEKGCGVVALTGRDGGRLGEVADLEINIPLQHMGQIEDCHMMVCHIVSYFLCQ